MYVRGVSILVPGQQRAVAAGLSGDDMGNELTLQLPDNPRPGMVTGRQYNIDMGGGAAIRPMTCVHVDRGGVATFQ